MRRFSLILIASLAVLSFFLVGCNEGPELAPIGNRTVNAGDMLQFEVLGFDPDGDSLDYSVENLPPGATFDKSSHVFTWNPGYLQYGAYTNVTFRVSDGDGESDSETISIFVNKVEAAYMDEVTEIDPDQAAEAVLVGDNVVFPVEGNEELLNLQPGDIIVSDYENGFLRRISQTDATDSEITFVTEQATIEELYEYTDLSHTIELNEGMDEPWINWDFSGTVLVDNPEGLPLRVEITDGHFILEPVVEVDLHIGGFPPEVETFYFAVGGQASLEVKVAALAGGQINWADEQVINVATLAPFTIPSTPIVVVPQINLILGAEATLSAQASAEAGVYVNSQILGGVQYSYGVWENVEVQDFDFYYYGPEVTADVSAQLEGHARVEVKFLFFNVAGPYLQVGPYAELMAELYPDCFLQLDAGVDGYVGIDMGMLWPGGPDELEWQLFNIRRTLYEEQCD